MTRYEPHCDCLGGHVSMLPDPNGRWCRADDPHPVADDPSGIVQQMPEGGDEVLAPCPFCGRQARVIAGQAGFYPPTAYCEQCEVSMKAPECLTDKLIAAWNRRATEADLRAEVERLRAGLAGARVAAMKEAVSICKRVRHEIDTDEGAAGALEAALAILDAMKEPCCAALAQGQKEGTDDRS